jgi:hypothetical protein
LSALPAIDPRPPANEAQPDPARERMFFRLIAIGVRKYSAEPASHPSSARLMLLNAVRLAVRHLGRKAVAEAVLSVLNESRGSSC